MTDPTQKAPALPALLAEFDSMWDHLVELATAERTSVADMIVLGSRRAAFKKSLAAIAAKEPALPPDDLHPKTRDLLSRFSNALAEKLSAAEKKYGYTDAWRFTDWEIECRAKLREHIEKGDPRDVAAYCAFMWHHGWSTGGPMRRRSQADDESDRIDRLRHEEP